MTGLMLFASAIFQFFLNSSNENITERNDFIPHDFSNSDSRSCHFTFFSEFFYWWFSLFLFFRFFLRVILALAIFSFFLNFLRFFSEFFCGWCLLLSFPPFFRIFSEFFLRVIFAFPIFPIFPIFFWIFLRVIFALAIFSDFFLIMFYTGDVCFCRFSIFFWSQTTLMITKREELVFFFVFSADLWPRVFPLFFWIRIGCS